MLLSAHLPLPKELLVHSFLNVKGTKMGKSTGNAVDPMEQVKQYGVDQFRFYILGSIPVDNDGEYSIQNIEERIDNELVANFSNFCYRTLTLDINILKGKIGRLNKEDPIILTVTKKFESIIQRYESRDFKQVVTETMEISYLGNKFLQDNQPWKNTESAPAVLTLATNLLKNMAILMHPITPSLSENLHKQLNLKMEFRLDQLNFDLEEHMIGTPEILVKRLQTKKGDNN